MRRIAASSGRRRRARRFATNVPPPPPPRMTICFNMVPSSAELLHNEPRVARFVDDPYELMAGLLDPEGNVPAGSLVRRPHLDRLADFRLADPADQLHERTRAERPAGVDHDLLFGNDSHGQASSDEEGDLAFLRVAHELPYADDVVNDRVEILLREAHQVEGHR